ncbi:porin family protein [uncultured Bacteroides sp.]|uniref:porin family protein n=1 Tax=uncultured Bacteroides sp. TaxID=162156 RepID=UPI002634C5E3|nr:porin family protein [uncultured Bacteroides sp.]
MKTIGLVILFYLMSALHAEGQNRNYFRNTNSEPKVNVGIKAGFNSSLFSIDHLTIGGQKISNIQNNYKVGYLGAIFCRINMKRHHFLQTEFSYNISNGSVSANRNAENQDIISDRILIKTTIHSIDLPLLYGYKFIDSYPYGMAFFLGPKVAYTWERHTKNEYSGFYQQDINEELHPLTFSGVVGLAVNIANIFFDFRYEAGFHNFTKDVSFDKQLTSAPYNEQEIRIKRRRNVLSFSVGVIF